MTDVRVRFAPSPTGHLHVGNARTALFNWLLARRHGGVFILRIEDTDRERSTPESERAILEDLRWLGLDWDEGPDVGGPAGPYRQSERLDRYAAAADGLLARGLAYRCFCTPADLEAARSQALAAGRTPGYSGRCRQVDPSEAERRVRDGEPAALRFAVPPGRTVTFADVVRGDLRFDTGIIGDPVILRSDGRPAYNFAVVVDDAAMRVTHVVRGEDHISNTPRQLLLYEALGETPPVFAHLALVMGPDHAPLSKRHGATSVAEFRARGVLPEALVNYLALLGWSPGGDEELVPVDDMARRFDLEAVGHSAAVFDPAKLSWMNRHYMTVADPARLAREALVHLVRAGYLRQETDASRQYADALLPLVVGSVDRLDQVPERLAFIFDWDAEQAAGLLASGADEARVVEAFAEETAEAGPLDRERFRAAAGRVRERTGFKGRALFHPVRVALTAADSGPELDLAVPAIDGGAALPADARTGAIPSCAERARRVAAALRGPGSGGAS